MNKLLAAAAIALCALAAPTTAHAFACMPPDPECTGSHVTPLPHVEPCKWNGTDYVVNSTCVILPKPSTHKCPAGYRWVAEMKACNGD
jgi:hypothetical protein